MREESRAKDERERAGAPERPAVSVHEETVGLRRWSADVFVRRPLGCTPCPGFVARLAPSSYECSTCPFAALCALQVPTAVLHGVVGGRGKAQDESLVSLLQGSAAVLRIAKKQASVDKKWCVRRGSR